MANWIQKKYTLNRIKNILKNNEKLITNIYEDLINLCYSIDIEIENKQIDIDYLNNLKLFELKNLLIELKTKILNDINKKEKDEFKND